MARPFCPNTLDSYPRIISCCQCILQFGYHNLWLPFYPNTLDSHPKNYLKNMREDSHEEDFGGYPRFGVASLQSRGTSLWY